METQNRKQKSTKPEMIPLSAREYDLILELISRGHVQAHSFTPSADPRRGCSRCSHLRESHFTTRELIKLSDRIVDARIRQKKREVLNAANQI